MENLIKCRVINNGDFMIETKFNGKKTFTKVEEKLEKGDETYTFISNILYEMGIFENILENYNIIEKCLLGFYNHKILSPFATKKIKSSIPDEVLEATEIFNRSVKYQKEISEDVKKFKKKYGTLNKKFTLFFN